MSKFENGFQSYVTHGCTITTTIDGITFQAKIAHDTDRHIDDDDSHNPDQSVTGCNDEQQKALLDARDAWKRDEWFFCGVIISAIHGSTGASWDHLASLWGIEANYPNSANSYLTEVANELLQEAARELQSKLEALLATI